MTAERRSGVAALLHRPLLPWLGLAAVAGVVWGLAFGRDPWPVASWLALAPLVLLMEARGGRARTFLLGFVHGLAAWLVAIPWIAPTVQVFGGLPAWLAVVCLLLLSGYLALFHGLFTVLGRRIWRRSHPAVLLLALPALWVALEWLRTGLFGGFPWNLAAYAWVEVPGALPTSAWIGAYGISFLLLFANVGVALGLTRWRRLEEATAPAAGRTEGGTAGRTLGPRGVVGRMVPAFRPHGRLGVRGFAAAALPPLGYAVLLPLLVLAAGARWGDGGAVDPHDPWAGLTGAPVRLLQPNIANAVDPDWTVIRRNYDRVLEMSQEACTPGSLLVWPESAAWPYSFSEDAAFRRDVLTLARSGGCTVLFNSLHPTEGGFYNSAFVVSPAGGVVRYDKRELVPFGEYVPLAGVFSFIDKLARNAGNFLPAADLTLLPWRPEGWMPEQLGMAICYEVVFPGDVADTVRQGASLLVTITNDAWYGDTSAPWQHYAAARFRAAESRRPLLRAAITGISAVVAPDGGEELRLDPFERGVIRTRVSGRDGLSPYTRAPWLVPLLCTLLAAGAWLAASFPRTRRRG